MSIVLSKSLACIFGERGSCTKGHFFQLTGQASKLSPHTVINSLDDSTDAVNCRQANLTNYKRIRIFK